MVVLDCAVDTRSLLVSRSEDGSEWSYTLIDGRMQWTRSITSPRRRTESTLWASLDDLVRGPSAIEKEIRDDGQER